MKQIILKFLELAVEYGIFYLILGSLITSLARAVFKFFSSQEVYNDVMRSRKIQILISKLSANRALLDASRVLVTRVHNGYKWLNSQHMNKLSIFKTLSIEDYKTLTRYRLIDYSLKETMLSELSEILIKVNDKPYDLISTKELSNDLELKKILRKDLVNYILLVKIAKGKKILGYIWILFSGDKQGKYDKEIYDDFSRVAAEIAEEFK